MVSSDLPKEILTEIFSRLPAKSVGKCRCLSKSWRTLLSTPQFVKSHLNQKNRQQQLSLFISYHCSIRSIDTIEDDTVSREIEMPHDGWIRVVGSCDGLVLLLNHVNQIFLLNPVTLQHARVSDTDKTNNYCNYGFGYDSSVDDYKIVEIWDKPDAGTGHSDTLVDVHYVKRGYWKRAQNSPYLFHHPLGVTHGAFLNDAIHWLAVKKDESGHIHNIIAAFDLAHEVFDEIPLPIGFDSGRIVSTSLLVFDGCLCIVDSKLSLETDVWIMKEYGLGESWTKYVFHADRHWKILEPLCYIGDEEEDVLVSTLDTLQVYNMRERTLRDVVVDGGCCPFLVHEACTFFGSIVSPFAGT